MAFNITAISGPNFASFFSWQNAIDLASGRAYTYNSLSSTVPPDSLVLIKDGCQIENGSNNCSIACQYPEKLWRVSDGYNGAYTMQNCMVYPIIAQLRSQKLLIPEADELAADFGILPNANATFSWPSIDSCIADYCQLNGNPEGCQNPHNASGELKPVNQKSQPFNFTLGFNENICDGLEAYANADLGGPGVFLSYLMQTAIVGLTWLVLRFYDSWSKIWFYVQERGRAAGKHDTPEEPPTCDPALKRHVKLRESEGRAVFIDAVKDFHKAQCFYMLTIQVALIIALTHQSELQAASYQQYWNDSAIVAYLSLGGCLPIVFVYLMLRLSERPSKDKNGNVLSTKNFRMEQQYYMAAISFLTAVFGLYNTTFLFKIGKSPSAAIAGNQVYIASCGGNYSPVQYCWNGEWLKLSNKRIHGLAYFAYAVMSFMLGGFGKKCAENIMGRSQATQDNRLEDNRLARVVRALLEIGLLCSNVILAYDYGRLLWSKRRKGTIAWGESEWSLGQIIAVTIWIPVILQYVWTLAGFDKEKDRESRQNSAFLPASITAQPATAAPTTSDVVDESSKLPAVSTSAVQGP